MPKFTHTKPASDPKKLPNQQNHLTLFYINNNPLISFTFILFILKKHTHTILSLTTHNSHSTQKTHTNPLISSTTTQTPTPLDVIIIRHHHHRTPPPPKPTCRRRTTKTREDLRPPKGLFKV